MSGVRVYAAAVAGSRWGLTFRQAWVRLREERGTMSRREFWVFATTVLGAFGATCLLFGGPLLLLPDPSTIPALIPIGLFSIYALCASIVVLLAVIVAAVQRVRESTGSGRYVALGWLNPLLLVALLVSPPFDRRRASALGDEYLDVWRKFADYAGVSTRREFYTFTGITAGLVIALIVVATLVARWLASGPAGMSAVVGVAWWSSVIVILLGAQIPWLPLAMRRTRDAYGEEIDENARIFMPLALQFPFVGMPLLFVVWLILCLRPSRNPVRGETSDLAKRDASSGLRRGPRGERDSVATRRGVRENSVPTRRAEAETSVPSHRSRYDPRFHRASRNRSHRRNLGDGRE